MPDTDNDTKFDSVAEDGINWLNSATHLCKAFVPYGASPYDFVSRPQITREIMAQQLCQVMKIMWRQNKYTSYLVKQNGELKEELIVKQRDVIGLQKELIASRDQQLTELKTTVVTSVENSVKAELKSYSDAVQKSSTSSAGTLLVDQKILKNVVKSVAAEDVRSRNLMIFGLPEETDEQVAEKVSQVLMDLGEKPRIEACRIGTKSSDENNSARPIKVSVSSPEIVHQIISKARQLRNSEQFNHVFITPDRSRVERSQQRELVCELKKRREGEPDKRHYIKGGQLCSAEKT